MSENPYLKMLPKDPEKDDRPAVMALRLFAEALQQYAGGDVEVPVAVHPLDSTTRTSKVQLSVYVPKTDYANLILIARVTGAEGFPVKLDPYFAGESFREGIAPCDTPEALDASLAEFAQSPQVVGLLDYMKRHAQVPRKLPRSIVVANSDVKQAEPIIG